MATPQASSFKHEGHEGSQACEPFASFVTFVLKDGACGPLPAPEEPAAASGPTGC
jgi:hypothetical protein